MRQLAIIIVTIFIATASSAQEWTKLTIDSNFADAWAVYATDVDCDGDTDVLGAAHEGDEIKWWENTDGSGSAWIEHTVDDDFTGASSVYAADVDGDGDIDVLGSATGWQEGFRWWENADGVGTSWTEHNIIGNFNHAYSVYAADMDGDGDIDALGAWSSRDYITWWENDNGVGTMWTEHIVDGDFDGAYSALATDIDGDGDIDVVAAAWVSDTIAWWENVDGVGTMWTEHIVDGNFISVLSVYATDMDGDGDIDVLGGAGSPHNLAWWENANGGGTQWIEHTVDGDFFCNSVYATDVDGDGDTDVLGANFSDGEIVWWENANGVGTMWTEHILDDWFYGANSVYATDVDSDGDTDILGAASINEIAWWEQPGSPYPDLIEISLVSVQPIQVPRGGSFQYEALVTSNLPSPYNVDFWTYVILPNGSPYGPLQQLNNVPMTPATIIGPVNLGLAIPQNAFLGEYSFHMQAGRFPTTIVGEDEFPFEVVAATGTSGLPSTDWSAWGLEQLYQTGSEQMVADVGTPATYSLSDAYPNPFNAATTLTVNLPASSELQVTVYNLQGRHVAELANGSYTTGTHRFTFDASTLASGLYFVRATAPGQFEQTQKLVLMR